MPDFIDKDAFLNDALKEPLMHHTLLYEIVERQPIAHIDDMAFKIQNELQAANPSGVLEITFVRHGRWIEDRTDVICSSCGCRYNGGLFCMSHEDDAFSRCPKCGAKLDLRTPTEAALDMADSVMMGGADNGN